VTIVLGEIPPFCIAAERNMIVGLNLVGMRRSGMSKDEINAVREAFRKVLRVNPPRQEMLEMFEERAKDSEAVRHMYDFIRTTKRPLSKTVRKAGAEMVGA
jgi:UDP-N-acetylglucosamine acyltransferase